MQLRNLRLNGLRRFRDQDVRLEGPVIAIVGRNEAGKTTILDALVWMNGDDEIPATALSERGDQSTDGVIELRFRLSDEDQTEAAAVADGHRPRWLIVSKPASGKRRFRVDPPVPRQIAARRACQAAVKQALDTLAIKAALPRDARGELATLLPSLDATSERLARAASQLLVKLDDQLSQLRDSVPAVAPLRQAISAARVEEERFTTAQTGEHLAGRMPHFLKFEENVRSLRSTYDLTRDGSRPALANLLKAGGLSADEINRALSSGDGGQLKSLIDRGERELTRILSPNWSQDSEVRVGLQIMEKHQLAISATTSGGAFHLMGERSDGLRSYVALRAFIVNEGGAVPPILLIDEAETHLHYDAQGDLVRMFEEQRDAAAVIYTTHSIACLPQDLGRGVRVVSRLPDSVESEVSNAWTADEAGVAPLLRRMGAATAVFSPSRYQVLGEGPSEPAILPTLFRQALGLRSLPFQVVGRTSSASEDELRALLEEGVKVALVLDGDQHGQDRADELHAIGFRKNQLVVLKRGYETEDLIDLALYAEAVTSHIKAWTGTDLALGQLTAPGRVDQVDRLCVGARIRPPGHNDVVGEVVRLLDDDESGPRRAYDPKAAHEIRRVYTKLLRALRISDAEAAVFRE